MVQKDERLSVWSKGMKDYNNILKVQNENEENMTI